MDYQQTLQYLYSQLPMFQRQGRPAFKADLSISIALDNYFGNPHTSFKSIHIAGTNGKGSVAHLLASVCQKAGYKTGLYTSPHLKDFRERIKINGKMISKQEVIDFVAQHSRIFEQLRPSFFEMSVALAFLCFARHKVDMAIVETGMGGRLDSTNIITPVLSVITNISYDHTQFLGTSLPEIAAEKAGIIKPEIPVVVGKRQTETENVFTEKAAQQNAPIFRSDDFFCIAGEKSDKQNLTDRKYTIKNIKDNRLFDLTIDLSGNYQRENVLTALTAIKVLKEKKILRIDEKHIVSGMADCRKTTGLNGRWQILSQKPLMVADTAHNAEGIQYVMKQISETPHNDLHIIFGAVNDKNIDKLFALLPQNAFYYFTKADIPRAMNEKELQQSARRFGLTGNAYKTVKQAIEAANMRAGDKDMIFIGGSTFVVAEAQ